MMSAAARGAREALDKPDSPTLDTFEVDQVEPQPANPKIRTQSSAPRDNLSILSPRKNIQPAEYPARFREILNKKVQDYAATSVL
jgi:hypothetical protein